MDRAASAPIVKQPDRRSLEDALIERIDGQASWLKANAPGCFEEQHHLDGGTREQIYWNYGYLLALRDVRDFLRRKRRALT